MASKPTYNDNVGLPEIHYNPLQNYRNVTYNTRLTMMPVAEATKTRLDRSYDYKKGIILWETGGAGTVYLEELTMECVGAGNKTGNYVTQLPINFKGKVVEPLGGRFMESLSLAAMDLGYKSNDGVYLFEISFTGFNTDSDLPEVCKGWDGEDLIFRWYVRLNELNMQLDYKGSTYDFEFISSHSIDTDYTILEDGFRMIGSPETIGSFCKELADALNKREKEHVEAGLRCIPHKYVITAHKDIANLKVKSGFWSRQTFSMLIGRGEIQGKPGQLIQTFILGAIANSEEMLKHLHRIPDKKDYNSNDTKPGKSEFVIRNVAVIPGYKDVEENKSYAFDPKLGSSAKEIHFFVTTKEDPRNIISPQEYKDAQDPAERNKRVDNWIKKGLLRKVYKWIYTGENSEVINTNIKLDYMWRNVRPIWVNSADGKPIAASGTASTAKQKTPAAGAKAITCNDAKSVGTAQQRVAATYAEDAEWDPVSGKLAPREGWYPHMPQFYHMNTGLTQQQQQGTVSKENANEYSVYRQIGANLSGSGEMVTLNLEVVGDPYWLMQIPGTPGKPPWEEDVWEYEKEQLTEDQMAEKRKKTATHTWLPFIYFEAQVPSATNNNITDTMKLRESDAISGVYFTVKLVNKFTKGKFTTSLECAREPLSNPWTGRAKPANSTPGSSPGSASSTGPNNAGATGPGTNWQQSGGAVTGGGAAVGNPNLGRRSGATDSQPTVPTGPGGEYTPAEATREANRLNRIQQQRVASGATTTVIGQVPRTP